MHVPIRLRLLALATALVAVPLALPSTAAGTPADTARTAATTAGDPVLVPVSAGATAALGHDRLGVRRGDVWHLNDALIGGTSRSYREPVNGWVPLAGDTDGDGADSQHLFRGGLWLLRDQEQGAPRVVAFGTSGDQPLLGDWDGDGVDTLGLFRGGTFLLSDEAVPLAPARAVGFGVPGDVAVVGDWDGDGDTDLGVRRGLTWFQRDASTAGPATRRLDWGLASDVPVAGDWDHDGRDTPGLFRAGTWFFRSSVGRVQTTRYGSPGDVPFVRRSGLLAPGVVHRVLRNPAAPYTAHVVTVDLAAASSPDVVVAGDRLGTLETVSSMAQRTRAVLAVNGDYHTSASRPVHLLAADGTLVQTPQLLGRAVGLDARGTTVSMGFPDLRVSVSSGALSADVSQVNSGGPSGSSVASYTPVGSRVAAPPAGACFATTAPAGARSMTGGSVRTPLTVGEVRCGGAAPGGSVLAMRSDPAASAFLRSLRPGSPVVQTAQLGFPGAVDVLGGNPMLVDRGEVVSGDVDGTDAFSARNPRTAVGSTRDGRLLVVVVDGRQGAYSSGATLRELAELMRSLGAVQAVNLDGGGSSEMVVNGVIANRPSDGEERPVSTGLVLLRGADGNEAALATPAAAQPISALGPAATDPGSTGGLADRLRRRGVPLPASLRAEADAFLRR